MNISRNQPESIYTSKGWGGKDGGGGNLAKIKHDLF